jgi:hypothetical protein
MTLVCVVKDTNRVRTANVPVTWAITAFPTGSVGHGLSVTVDTTDEFGEATTVLTLGHKAGTFTVTATATGLKGSPRSFTETVYRSDNVFFGKQ